MSVSFFNLRNIVRTLAIRWIWFSGHAFDMRPVIAYLTKQLAKAHAYEYAAKHRKFGGL